MSGPPSPLRVGLIGAGWIMRHHLAGRATIAHFVDRLADGAPFETGPADNLATLDHVETCYRLAGREDAR